MLLPSESATRSVLACIPMLRDYTGVNVCQILNSETGKVGSFRISQGSAVGITRRRKDVSFPDWEGIFPRKGGPDFLDVWKCSLSWPIPSNLFRGEKELCSMLCKIIQWLQPPFYSQLPGLNSWWQFICLWRHSSDKCLRECGTMVENKEAVHWTDSDHTVNRGRFKLHWSPKLTAKLLYTITIAIT